MNLLLFHNPPINPIFWGIVLALSGFSIFLVFRGISGFMKSGRKGSLAIWGSIAVLVLMTSFSFLNSPEMATVPFGLGAGLIPYAVLSVMFAPEPGQVHPRIVVYLVAGIGSVLNVIACFSLGEIMVNLLKRLLGTAVLPIGTSDRRARLR